MGGMTRAWTNVATVWCSITPVAGSEHPDAMAMRQENSFQLRMRYRPTLPTTDWRLVFPDGSLGNISNVIDVDQRHWYVDVHYKVGQ
jgi:SPP1 family predicted phage head-tail adaptor